MPEYDEYPVEPAEPTRPVAIDRERTAPGLAIALGVGVAAIAAVVVWYAFGRGAPGKPELPAAAPEATAPETAPAPTTVDTGLPALDASDALVRELAARLSSHPTLASWLIPDDLIRRFVASVVNLAEGTSPSSHLRFLTPATGFRVYESSGRTYIAQTSFGRWDLFTEVFHSLDTQGTAELYRRLHPLFEQAYLEVGDPSRSFDDTLALAVASLLATPLPEPPYELVPQDTVWAWADRSLEQRDTAQKHLLRLGPANARRVQEKLRELAGAIGLDRR